ncbi:glycosyltransferase [uncultured Lacticaseibacillus sp.]|uniref:glycosyltransferase n=1 Tax=uncultured Lacticaseibacillus sp. TaxID=2775882 RepID=UPI00259738AA|nr:glycosyltransferase [uncultured Lacticaseibacillus sp.]
MARDNLRKKRIAIVLPDFSTGGMPRVASNLIKGLLSGYSVDLILLNTDGPIRFNTFGVRVIRISHTGRSAIGKVFNFITRFISLRSLIRENDYDVVIGYGVTVGTLVLAAHVKTRVIIQQHNVMSIENNQWGMWGKVYNYCVKHYYRRAYRIVAISSLIALDLEDNYYLRDNVEIIPNPYDLDFIKNQSRSEDVRQELASWMGQKCVICVGRFTPVKNQVRLVSMFKDVVSELSESRLLLVGEGPTEKLIIEKINELHLNKFVRVIGYADNPYSLMSKAAVLALPSLNEGFPNVLVEALASGTRIVADDCPSGPRDVFQVVLGRDNIGGTKICRMGTLGYLTPAMRRHDPKSNILDKAEACFCEAIKMALSDGSSEINEGDLKGLPGLDFKKITDRFVKFF